MMKKKCFVKSIIALFTLLVGMLLVPVLFVRISPPDAGLAVGMLLFFLVNPLICLGLGILAGTQMRCLWWICLLPALCYPPFFAVASGCFDPDLYGFSAVYLIISAAAMAGTHFYRVIREKRKK